MTFVDKIHSVYLQVTRSLFRVTRECSTFNRWQRWATRNSRSVGRLARMPYYPAVI